MKQILFNTDMVRAILDGRKTVTRRLVKKSAVDKFVIDDNGKMLGSFNAAHPEWGGYPTIDDATYQPDDILYVRETWQEKRGGGYLYKADAINSFDLFITPEGRVVSEIPWRPSIHMPKEAARLFLRVTDVWVERLQDITADGCKQEGIWDDYKASSQKYHDALVDLAYPKCFAELWNSTIKPSDLSLYGWEANPWVWVIEFERISKEKALY